MQKAWYDDGVRAQARWLAVVWNEAQERHEPRYPPTKPSTGARIDGGMVDHVIDLWQPFDATTFDRAMSRK